MAGIPLPSNSFVYKRVSGTNPAANTEISDTVPVGTNEVQTIAGTPSATFALTIDGVTGPTTLSTTATAQNVQDYLNAFNQYAPSGVVCTGGPLPSSITITYSGGTAAARNVSAPTVAGGVTGLTITTTTQGSGPKSWWLLSVTVALVQAATQTPQPILIIDDGTTSIFESFGSSAAQAVSTTCQYTWAGDVQLTGQVGATTNVHSVAPLPQNLLLGPGYRIRTSTVGIGANSNYGAPSYYVIEFS
jgi:hypothetical protein